MEVDVISNMWDKESQSMKDFHFKVKLDIHKLTPKLLRKAIESKVNKTLVASGALTIIHVWEK